MFALMGISYQSDLRWYSANAGNIRLNPILHPTRLFHV
jgi:hypothetical protein